MGKRHSDVPLVYDQASIARAIDACRRLFRDGYGEVDVDVHHNGFSELGKHFREAVEAKNWSVRFDYAHGLMHRFVVSLGGEERHAE